MAAPIDAGSIYSDVRIRLDRLNADLKAVSTGFDKLGKGIQKGSDETTKTQTNNFKKVGLAGVAAIGVITLAFKKAISVFAATEQSLANVEAVSNATAAEFRELEQAASDAGTTTRFTAGQAAEALFFLSSAGLTATESVKALDGVLVLAGATGSSLAQTAQAVTSTLSQFGLESEKAADIANIFAAANSNSQATLDKLQGSLRQVGPVAAGLGIGLEEVVGSLQALFNAGFQGEAAGRALKSALADLANQASPTVQKLEALGVSFASVNPEAVGLTNAIGALEDAGLSTGEVMDAFGKVAGPQLLTLINTGKSAIENYTDAVTGTNEAARQYAVQNDTLAGSFDALKSAGEGAGNAFIATLTPVLRSLIDLIAGFLRLSAKVPSVFKGIGTGAAVAATGFLALSKALAILGVTLSTGPLAIVAGIGAAVVGLTALAQKAKEVREVRLAEEFGELAKELGLTGQAIDDFTIKAGDVEKLFTQSLAGGASASFERVKRIVGETAEELGLVESEVIKVALTSKNVTDEYKEQLKLLSQQITEQQILAELAHEEAKNELQRASGELARLEIDKARIETAREEARIAQETEARELLAEERSNRLIEIKKQLILLDDLALRGAITEKDALEEKKALREEEISLLLDQAITSGVVSDQVVADIAAQQAAIDGYSERLELLDSQSEENLEKEKERDEERVQAWDDLSDNREKRHAEMLVQIGEDAEDAFKKQEKLDEEEKQRKIDNFDTITSLASQFFNALVSLSAAATEAQIADLEAQRDADIAAIDERTKAKLESLGLLEDTELQSLQKKLSAAIAAGDTETENEFTQEIQRTIILQSAEDEKVKAKEKADAKIRELKRDQAKRDKAAAIIDVLINTAVAISQGFSQLGPIGGAIAAIALGVIGAVQVGVIAAKPLPALQTGGIVLPQSGGTAAILAENGSPELALNAGSEGEGLLNMFAQKVAAAQGGGSGGSFTLILQRDGRKEAEAVIQYVNNGVVKLEI